MAEEQTQLLVNGLWKYHLATRKYYFSPEICEIFNLDIQDLKSHDVFLERIHPDDRAYYSTTFEERLGKQQHFTLAYRIVLEHGTVKDIEEDVEILRDEASAHPKFDYKKNELLTYSYQARGDATTDFVFYVIGADGKVAHSIPFHMPYAGM